MNICWIVWTVKIILLLLIRRSIMVIFINRYWVFRIYFAYYYFFVNRRLAAVTGDPKISSWGTKIQTMNTRLADSFRVHSYVHVILKMYNLSTCLSTIFFVILIANFIFVSILFFLFVALFLWAAIKMCIIWYLFQFNFENKQGYILVKVRYNCIRIHITWIFYYIYKIYFS